MTYRIIIKLNYFITDLVMEVFVPDDQDPEEYIDYLLETILTDELRYSCDWEFC